MGLILKLQTEKSSKQLGRDKLRHVPMDGFITLKTVG
jgi:hypothetical protein